MQMLQSILYLNGTLPPLKVVAQLASFPVVAADGAANRLVAIGHPPNWTVGDGDSLKAQGLPNGSEVLLESDQESTDFEKCLKFLARRSLFPTLVCGIGGGEIDHVQNNLFTFMAFSQVHPMCFLDLQEGSPAKIGFSVQEVAILRLRKEASISLLPFPKATVTAEGLVWPLCREVLSMSRRSGARNRSDKSQVKITVHEGQLLAILDADALSFLSVDMRMEGDAITFAI